MTDTAGRAAPEQRTSTRDRLLRVEFGRGGIFALAAMALLAGALTYGALFGSETPPKSISDIPSGIILFDLAVLALLAVAITRRVWSIWTAHRDGRAGAGLHMRLASLFAGAAIIPAVLVAGFSMLFFDLRIEGFFSDRAQKAVSESVAIAEKLIQEHRATVRADVLAMAQDLNRVASQVQGDPALLTRLITTQAGARGLSEAMVFDRTGTVLARTSLTFDTLAEQLPISAIEEADEGNVVSFPRVEDTLSAGGELTSTGKSGALVQLDGFLGAYRVYLYIARFVEPSVAAQVERAQQAAGEYERLAAQRFSYEFTFVVLFIVVAVLLMLAAVWLALNFSTRISVRLGGVVEAAETIRDGDLRARVITSGEDDEIDMLGRTFNRMARQLESQQGELVRANRALEERRRFMETVLSGVSAGVIGTDEAGIVDVPNRSASRLLGLQITDLVGRPLVEAVPEMADLVRQAEARPHRVAEGEITIQVEDERRIFFTRVSTERRDKEVLGFVVTFDDISALVAAQRTAVWADVARRIAHEIRNPLTPIQLSAERLKRRYLKRIEEEEDREIFQQCTDTIVRQVGDIGRMIEEFSAFARMPAPSMKLENLSELIKQSVFPVQVAHAEVEIATDLPPEPAMLTCDARQFGQVMTNVLNNACESIERRPDDAAPGRIEVKLICNTDAAVITVTDNGVGLPAEERDRLTEPYVTTRDKGTGLGLAIVRKIVEDHAGTLHLGDRREGAGARVTLTFPFAETRTGEAAAE
ncbi:MAG: ATP-binding protein [Minwuia sp.]|uniref:sensor histidine kinase NtrY-like n=1 Tax=Minwuia sp. TaxID=2493630 RepID=UPI003A8B4BDB